MVLFTELLYANSVCGVAKSQVFIWSPTTFDLDSCLLMTCTWILQLSSQLPLQGFPKMPYELEVCLKQWSSMHHVVYHFSEKQFTNMCSIKSCGTWNKVCHFRMSVHHEKDNHIPWQSLEFLKWNPCSNEAMELLVWVTVCTNPCFENSPYQVGMLCISSSICPHPYTSLAKSNNKLPLSMFCLCQCAHLDHYHEILSLLAHAKMLPKYIADFPWTSSHLVSSKTSFWTWWPSFYDLA